MDTAMMMTAPASATAVAEKNRLTGIKRELNAIATIMGRGVLLALKSPASLVMSLAMPVVMMYMIGGNLQQNMAGGLGFDFGPYMLIGMLVNMLFMMTCQGLSSLVEDRETDFTQEMLIAPVSRHAIVIGTILGSAFLAVFSCLGTLVVGLFMGIRMSAAGLLAVFALSPLMCLAAGAFGMLLLGAIKNRKAANMALMIIPMAQMFLSGAIIPITHSGGALLVLSRLMPMTYCLDLVRAVVYAGTPEYASVVLFNPAITLTAIIGLMVAFLVIGTWLFARSERNK